MFSAEFSEISPFKLARAHGLITSADSMCAKFVRPSACSLNAIGCCSTVPCTLSAYPLSCQTKDTSPLIGGNVSALADSTAFSGKAPPVPNLATISNWFVRQTLAARTEMPSDVFEITTLLRNSSERFVNPT